ncbi:MAG: cystine ABC transporter substrate-binding protein [Treponemataceae bacterium]|nr:MAG: cystine ABC transporter substrate-binding protein [Treponemataceae bacterium]
MRIFLTLCVCVCAMTGMCAGCARYQQQRGLTIEKGVLSVGIEIGYPPMEYYDTDGKTLAGFDIQLTQALAEKMGLKVKYIDTAWDGILAGLRTGKYDIAVNITILPERQAAYNFTKPYINNSITIAVLKNSSVKIEKPEDIAGYRAAFQGDTTAQYFAAKLNRQGVNFTSFSYDKIINCFDDLRLGRVDCVVSDSLAACYYTEKENSLFKTGWQGAADETIGICLKKGNDALTGALNKALGELFDDGVVLRISQDIFKRDMVSSVKE